MPRPSPRRIELEGRQAAGILLLLAVILLIRLLRAAPGTVFPPRWWHFW